MIFAVLRKFLRMLYAFDSSRNCVVFAYPNICKRAEKKSAHALNVNNMNYDTSYVFHFTSERNRGVNVLFECEKFGRNLQLNILVTFLPDSDMSYDDMLQYALSAKDSVYVKSFLESILQAIDSSLTANSASIYD